MPPSGLFQSSVGGAAPSVFGINVPSRPAPPAPPPPGEPSESAPPPPQEQQQQQEQAPPFTVEVSVPVVFQGLAVMSAECVDPYPQLILQPGGAAQNATSA